MTDDALWLRVGTAADVAEIARVHRLSRAWYYRTEADASDGREAMWAHLIAQPGRIVHVAERSGGLVGFMSALREDELEDTITLPPLYVLPDCAGTGVGPR